MRRLILLLISIVISGLLSSCISIDKVIDYKMPKVESLSSPIKLNLRHIVILRNGTRVDVNDYFTDLLTIQLKNEGLKNISMVADGGDMDLIFSDDRNYVSLRVIDKNGKVRFISVYSHKSGSRGYLNTKEYDKLIEELAGEFIAWLIGKKEL